MVRTILKYGEPMLEQVAEPVTEFDTPELNNLIADMWETMYAAKGVGLAAPQIGTGKRISIIDISVGEDETKKLVIINPEITFRDGKQVGEEGCLSIPGFREPVARANKVSHPRSEREGRIDRIDWRGAARARHRTRDRSSERHPLHQSPQRSETRHHPPQDQEAAKGRRVGLSGWYAGGFSWHAGVRGSFLAGACCET